MTEKETTDEMLMQLIKEECVVDTSDSLEYPPLALSLGNTTIQTKSGSLTFPIPIATMGNISVVTAPPKTKKTFFLSLLASVYLSDQNSFGADIKGYRDDNCLVHLDTEQGAWHAQRVFKRVQDMSSNKKLGCYQTYALRTINYKQRLEFIEYILKENKDKNGLILIDGIADLVSDVNNIEESNLCVQKLMELSARYSCHIMTVIHQNFGSAKLGTGHLGSFLEKKSETVIQLETNTTNKDWVTAICKRSRGYSFETFSFSVNDFGLPYVVGHLYDPLENIAIKKTIDNNMNEQIKANFNT